MPFSGLDQKFYCMNTLHHYGWNDFHHQQFITNKLYSGLLIGRVISIRAFKYFLITEKGEIETELSGKLLFASSNEELPKVGDWVAFMDYGTLGYIIEVLPRMNVLSRKNPGNKTEKQVLAANIDCAIIVQGLDRDFNIMRIDRYIVQMLNCGIRPMVVLNKADLVTDKEPFSAAVDKLKRDVAVHFCSTYNGDGVDDLNNNRLEAFRTYILLGSSGVGKSSLLNALTSHELQKVNATSKSTSKGKHTTSARDLFVLPNGSLMIDSPGMREFGVTSAEEGTTTEELFPAIGKLAASCRFSDCSHMHEEGCAVLKAFTDGSLAAEVYESFVKLVKEQRRFQIDADEKKRQNRQAGKTSREATAHRKKFKY